jgi:hypothetical protein
MPSFGVLNYPIYKRVSLPNASAAFASALRAYVTVPCAYRIKLALEVDAVFVEAFKLLAYFGMAKSALFHK